MAADDLEELDLVSAIWILASRDENHLITYEGIRDRLGLPAGFDVRAIVMRRRELFRPGAPLRELAEWKEAMRNGHRIPQWIKQIDDGAARTARIEGLGPQDMFRSLFRTQEKAPASPIEIVTWGLDHLDRLRKGRIASHEAAAQSWQMWLVFGVGILNIAVSIVVALASK